MDELALRQANGGDDEEAALRRALALSEAVEEGDAADEPPHKHGRSASTATTASTASSPSSPPASGKPEGLVKEEPPEEKTVKREPGEGSSAGLLAATASAAPPSLLSINRKAMEAERLARRQKQLAQQPQHQTHAGGTPEEHAHSLDDTQHQAWKLQPRPQSRPAPRPHPTKRKADDDVVLIADEVEDDDDVVIVGESTRHSGHAARRRRIDGGVRGEASAATPPTPKILPYATGVVKKTWVRGQPRPGDDIKIEEIWQKQDLELAILSSFQWDEEWMMARLDMNRTRLMLIAYAADEDQKEQMRANVPGDKIRFCFPPMPPMGFMHSKLQLLKFPGFLRLVVPTGNLTPYDWGETGTIENMVFIIDLPKLSKEQQEQAKTDQSFSTPFLEDLYYFLTAQGLDESLVRSLRKFDFSATSRYAFVHSIAGSHLDAAWKRTGYSGLGRAVAGLGWATKKPVQVDYICSSIGAVKDDLLNALYYACQGDSGLKELGSRAGKSKKGQSISDTSPRTRLRLYFPSQETVEDSLGGKGGAGTICFQAKWWDSPIFPREILRDAPNVRPGVLLHTKLLLVRTSNSNRSGAGRGDSGPPRGWAYLGSANMSESAWGRLVKDRATGKTKMTCRNWECGVLIPCEAGVGKDEEARGDEEKDKEAKAADDDGLEDSRMLDVFRGQLPVPLTLPGVRYSVNRPWFFMDA